MLGGFVMSSKVALTRLLLIQPRLTDLIHPDFLLLARPGWQIRDRPGRNCRWPADESLRLILECEPMASRRRPPLRVGTRRSRDVTSPTRIQLAHPP